MTQSAQGSNGFTNVDVLPTTGQRIIVRWHDGGRICHIHGLVTDVTPDEGRVTIEHPPGVARFLWFPEIDAAWREAYDPEYYDPNYFLELAAKSS